MLKRLLPVVLIVTGGVAPSALGAGLPVVQRSLTAPVSAGTSCVSTPSEGGTTTYRAPMAGYLTTTLHGTGDWDLALDGANGQRLGASQGFGGNEVVQTWVGAGDTITAVACRRPGATGTAKVAFTLVDAKPATQTGATRVARVRIARQAQVAQLDRAGLDASHRQTAHSADVVLNGDKDLAALKRTGLSYRIVTRNLYRRDERQLALDATQAKASALPSGRTTYRTYEDYGTELKQLVDQNPGLVRPVTIGKSFQGRDITGVEIANDVNADDGRPVYFVMGVHHAREWPAGEAAMELAELLTKSKSDPRIARILANERVLIVPLINPDGFVVSRTSYSPSDQVASLGDPTGISEDYGQLVEGVSPPGGNGAYRRKNCDGLGSDPTQPCQTQYGVDNNRNYGNLWGGSGGSPDPTSQSFHGPAPRSEPETQAVFNYVRTHEVTALITLHTVAALVLRPPGLKQLGLAPDEPRLKELGDAMANAAGYTSQYSWQLYDTAGTTEDDTYAATGGYGYTYELGTDDTHAPFHGAYQTSVINEWTGENNHAKNRGGVREALLLGAEAADSSADHAILKGTAPAGRILHLTKKFQTKTSDYCPMGVEPVLNVEALPSDICPGSVQKALTLDDTLDAKTTVPASGQFEWHIGQSTRPFVNGGAVLEKDGTPSQVAPDIAGDTGTPMSTADQKFTLPAKTDKLTVTLTADVPTDDYDIEVLKDGKSLGTSGQSPPSDEVVEIPDAEPGEYVVRVTNYLAIAGGYTIKTTKTDVQRTVTTGTKESYTLTCEDTAGKVYKTIALTIDRGQTITANPCSEDAPAQIGPVAGTPTGKLYLRFTGLRLKPDKHRRIRFRIDCPEGAPATCKGRFRLVTTLKGKTAFVASRRFAIKGGASRTVSPIVRKRVYKALRRGKKIKLRVRLTGKAGTLGLIVQSRHFAALKRPK